MATVEAEIADSLEGRTASSGLTPAEAIREFEPGSYEQGVNLGGYARQFA